MALVLLKASEPTGVDHFQTQAQKPQEDSNASTLQAQSIEQKIHNEALRAAEEFRRSESALIDALMAVDRARVFIKFGYPSLFKYALDALKLSEATAYNYITVARKSREVPALQESISAGTLSVSKAKKIAAVITPVNQAEWIEKAQTLSSRQLEKEVARENPRLATPERAVYVSGKRLELTLGVEESLMLKIRRAQDQVSRSKNRAVSLEETLEVLANFYLERKDPVEKAKRVIAKKGTRPVNREATELVTGPNSAKAELGFTLRTRIPAPIAHQVRLRDQGQCQFKRSNQICASRRWTDLHHIRPVSQGGAHTRDNLITLCRAHHQQAHHR